MYLIISLVDLFEEKGRLLRDQDHFKKDLHVLWNIDVCFFVKKYIHAKKDKLCA